MQNPMRQSDSRLSAGNQPLTARNNNRNQTTPSTVKGLFAVGAPYFGAAQRDTDRHGQRRS